ncbi:Aste57867_19923 [Aphanomyces stellatus]|uniref:Aste57867_19923 protein n=1 Tax=Aphanomyces stellatus TaxID=120398 RepID=A0A485LDW7_9STRA|nr:hypothetical protein As57867_019857 [Aphanomyces stellatus]VFT96621.1 Aste57867_19923 [Aphanomyces stellatus]
MDAAPMDDSGDVATVATPLWEECADESGRMFFVNKETGESAWEIPSIGTVDSPTVDAVDGIIENATEPHEGDSNDIEAALPSAVLLAERDIPPTDECTKTLKRTHSFVMDPHIQSRLLTIRGRLLGETSTAMDASSMMSADMTDEEWVLSFDPIGKHEYFYDCRTGSMTTQAPPSYRSVDPLLTWLLVLQCAIRCALARRCVAQKRLQTRAPARTEDEEVMEKIFELTQTVTPPPLMHHPTSRGFVKRKSLLDKDEGQREADERRAMMQIERAQCSQGDRFWGIDNISREIRRQMHEECMMREAEELRRALQEAARRREELQRRAAEEQERKRRSEDSALELRERNAMQVQELLQCKTDTFWGVQKQENDEKCCQQQMIREDFESHKYMEDVLAAQLHARWGMEAARALKEDNMRRLHQENRHRKQGGPQLFNRATTSESILLYRWPTQTAFVEPPMDPSTTSRPKRKAKESDTKFQYMLDVVLDPERRANPKHIFHTASNAHTVGRKGKLELSQPPSCYHLEKPRVEHKPLSRPPLSMAKTPSPHQSATANGLPYSVDPMKSAKARLSKAALQTEGKRFSLSPLQPVKENQVSDVAPVEAVVIPTDERFAAEEDNLAHVFELIDTDHGGTLDLDEMRWALTKDAFVRTTAMNSIVLKEVLKKRSVDALFKDMDKDGTNSISWPTFREYCHAMFVVVVAEQERKRLEKGPEVDQSKDEVLKRKNEAYLAKKAILDQEEAIAKIVFGLVDTDRSGKIDQHEMMNALDNNDRVREFVARSRGLRPLLENPAFGKAFIGMATDDSDGMNLDEFLCFCTEIASVAMLNDLVAAP